MATHSSTLAWKIPWTEEPGGLQSMGFRRVGHNFTFTFTFHFHALEKEMATHSSVLAWRILGTEEPGGLPSMGLQSRTRLMRLSSSSSSSLLLSFILCHPLLLPPSIFPSIRVFWSEVKSLSRVWLFVTPWTAAYYAPLSMGFSRQEYWSGLPFPSPDHRDVRWRNFKVWKLLHERGKS